jgi:hypothetical protein
MVFLDRVVSEVFAGGGVVFHSHTRVGKDDEVFRYNDLANLHLRHSCEGSMTLC